MTQLSDHIPYYPYRMISDPHGTGYLVQYHTQAAIAKPVKFFGFHIYTRIVAYMFWRTVEDKERGCRPYLFPTTDAALAFMRKIHTQYKRLN